MRHETISTMWNHSSCQPASQNEQNTTTSQHHQLTHLHGVHCNVDAAIQQRLIDLLGEQALAANVGQRLVQHLVTGGLDDDNLQRSLLCQLSKVLLQVASDAIEWM
jgi:hypothetical protein